MTARRWGQLYRYITRPALANERVQTNAKLRALLAPQVVPLVVPQEPEQPAPEAKPAECEATCAHHRAVRLSWARRLKRVFDLDLQHCPNCAGQLKIIAAILEQPVLEKTLTHLGLQARTPPGAPAGDAAASDLTALLCHHSGGAESGAAATGCVRASWSRG